MIDLYYGFDPREEVGCTTFVSSVIHHASVPVKLAPLHLGGMRGFYAAGQRDGTNSFTYARFLIPYMQGFTGWAIFMDGADMIVKADVAELIALREMDKAVMVVPHSYKTRHPRKYIGTPLEADNDDYPRKNWSSVMLINCSHFAWRQLTPEKVAAMKGPDLHRFGFIPEERIGYLPATWNWLTDEYGPNPDAKVLHWTAGLPIWTHYENAPHAEAWRAAHSKANHA